MTNSASQLDDPARANVSGAPPRTWLGLAGYLGLLAVGVGIFWLVRLAGEGLDAPPIPADARPVGQAPPGQVDVVLHVLATLAAVVGFGLVLGRICRYFGQPAVIGEVLAGILLGPSLLGAFAPELMHRLIPAAADDPHGQVPAALRAVSQLGVILYMFLVGLELNAARLVGKGRAAVAVSHSSIVTPFVLGAILALALYPRFSHQGVPFTSFALFLGAAMAITAFPVLARILTDRRLDQTELGAMCLTCAAADDVTAWCLLAFVVGVAQANVSGALAVVGGAVAYVVLMLVVVRPLLARWIARGDASAPLSPLATTGTLLAVLASALATEAIGIHAVFGAFLLGAVIPHDSRIAREFPGKMKDVVTILLLPAFFAFTGMRTEIRLVSGVESWFWCAAIILVATAGKFGGTVIAGKLAGIGWRDASALGVLMNTRGLMELIVLNIGLDLGVISPTLFAMMVVMALVTTAATAPLLQALLPDDGGPVAAGG